MTTCAFARCQKKFEPVVAWQKYCCNSHRIVAWQERKKSKLSPAAEVLVDVGKENTPNPAAGMN